MNNLRRGAKFQDKKMPILIILRRRIN